MHRLRSALKGIHINQQNEIDRLFSRHDRQAQEEITDLVLLCMGSQEVQIEVLRYDVKTLTEHVEKIKDAARSIQRVLSNKKE